MIFFISVLHFLASVHILSSHGQYTRQEESDCTTPEGDRGRCRNIKQCPELLEVLKRASNNEEASQRLKRLRCSSYAEVCCKTQVGNYERDSTSDPNASLCGRTTVTQVPKVVGGQPADLGAWPWIAALGYIQINSRDREVAWRCGGSLINKRYVLTAAHCIKMPANAPFKLVTVRLGEHDLYNDTDGANPVDYNIERSIVHEEYGSQKNDIGLLRLDRDVTYSDHIRPICLPLLPTMRTADFVRKYPFLAGWGETKFSGYESDVLLQVQIPVVSNEGCKKAYDKFGVKITNKHLCAGFAKGGRDSCRGDSGGPLMLPQTGIYYQIGVISFGYKCAEPGYPGVYTRVSSYIDWIKTNTNDFS